MHDWESLSHVRWDCKYHVVIVPKYRRRALYVNFAAMWARFFGICVGSVVWSCWKGPCGQTMCTCV